MKNFVKSIILASMAIVLIASCNNGSKVVPGDAIFKATIQGIKNTSVLLMEANPFIVTPDTVKVDDLGNFIYTKHLESPTYFEVVVGSKNRFPIFLLPGDTMFMSVDVAQFGATQKFSGNASIYNNYITEYTNSSNEFQKNIYTQFSKPEEEAVKLMDSLRDNHLAALESLKNANSDLNPYFIKMEKARILYEWALWYNIYPMYFRYLNKTESFQTTPEYDSYLGAVDINDSSLLSLGIYQSFLDTYVGKEMENYYKDDELRAANPSTIKYRLELIDRLFTNNAVKQVLAYKAVMDYVSYDGIKDYDLYFDYFKTICPNEGFQKIVNGVLDKWQHLKKGMPAYNFSFVNMDGKEVTMADFKGKYVYVDVWATWCNPCLGEIPSLKKMEEEFKGKNIAFVSISVDQTQDPWRAMVVNDTLKGVQLWAGQAKEFSEFYKITGIPRFMLFDQEGNILEASATRPSGGVDKQIAELPGL